MNTPPTDTAQSLYASYQSLRGNRDAREQRYAIAQRLTAIAPSAMSWMCLAFEHFAAFRMGEGHAALAQVLACDPGFLPARWSGFQQPNAIAPASDDDAAAFAARWADGVAYFEQLDFHDPVNAAHIWGCVGQSTAFFRHYLGECSAEQRRYGTLVRRMMSALAPDLPPRSIRSGRRRILFASAWLRDHTVTRLFAPLFEALDPAHFELHALQLDGARDAWTERVARHAMVHTGPRPIQTWYQLIAHLQPDVIVWLDIGMHPIPQALAALRLAPVQCTLWGHPVTTGLSTVDWFLSPDAIEPADARAHYSERLLRLPGLGHALDPPTVTVAERANIRRPEAGSIELVCAQSVYKLLPAQDELFARILAKLPQARLHLIPHPDAAVRDWLRARMTPAFDAHGADIERQLLLHGYGTLTDFVGLGLACDLNLDSLGWSGGMSAFDLLGAGVVTLTLPGATMRSRQTASMLELLEAPELIANDPADYVAKAVALALAPERRQHLSQRLRQHRHRLYNAAPALAAFADFLGRVEATPTS